MKKASRKKKNQTCQLCKYFPWYLTGLVSLKNKNQSITLRYPRGICRYNTDLNESCAPKAVFEKQETSERAIVTTQMLLFDNVTILEEETWKKFSWTLT